MRYFMILFCLIASVAVGSFARPVSDGGEVVICGKVLNRDFYPNEREFRLSLSYFSGQDICYTTPLRDDGSFFFRFPLCDALCEVSLANYAPRLYVSAGDSLYLQIDFKDLLHPVVKGSRAALNQGMQHFVGEGYYLPDYYYAEDVRASGEAFDKAVEKGYEERKQRRADFLTRYSPGDDVAKLTERMLLADYCAERFRYAREHLRQILIEKRTDWKQEMAGYEALLPEVNALLSDEVITSAHFRLLYHLNFYLQYRRYAVGDESFTDMDLVDEQQGNMLSQFLLANMLGNSLVHNDTVDFTTARPKYDALVQVPVLRHAVDLLYRRTMEYLQHPEEYSYYLLHGDASDSEAEQYMAPLRSLIDKHRGKVVYIDFWGVHCPPCLAEIEPMKKLRARYSTDDVVIISICGSGKRADYERILQRFSLRDTAIESLFLEDWVDSSNWSKIRKHLGIDGIPYFLLVNKEGVIVNYGSMVRPSWPQTPVQIDRLIAK